MILNSLLPESKNLTYRVHSTNTSLAKDRINIENYCIISWIGGIKQINTKVTIKISEHYRQIFKANNMYFIFLRSNYCMSHENAVCMIFGGCCLFLVLVWGLHIALLKSLSIRYTIKMYHKVFHHHTRQVPFPL